jgi:hypothetical protein
VGVKALRERAKQSLALNVDAMTAADMLNELDHQVHNLHGALIAAYVGVKNVKDGIWTLEQAMQNIEAMQEPLVWAWEHTHKRKSELVAAPRPQTGVL